MPEIRTAMILAAGRGTRMGTLTDNKPKPLMEIKGKTLLDYICQKLAHYGMQKAIVNTALLLPDGRDGLFIINADALWDEPTMPILTRLAQAWNPAEMDFLLALVPKSQAIGDKGRGNYFTDGSKLRRIMPDETDAPYFYMGVHILHPRVFKNIPGGVFSLRDLFDKAQQNGRLAYVVHDGSWYHVGTPQALQEANDRYAP